MSNFNIVSRQRRASRLAAVVALTFALAACSTIDKVRDPEPAFALAQHATWLQGGLSSVRGRVKLGDAVPQTCTDHSVYLLPDSPFFEYKVKRIAKGEAASDVGLADDRFDHLVHVVACGPNGEYSFDYLPEANWILISTIGLPKNALGPVLETTVKTQSGLTTTLNLDQSTQLTK